MVATYRKSRTIDWTAADSWCTCSTCWQTANWSPSNGSRKRPDPLISAADIQMSHIVRWFNSSSSSSSPCPSLPRRQQRASFVFQCFLFLRARLIAPAIVGLADFCMQFSPVCNDPNSYLAWSRQKVCFYKRKTKQLLKTFSWVETTRQTL